MAIFVTVSFFAPVQATNADDNGVTTPAPSAPSSPKDTPPVRTETLSPAGTPPSSNTVPKTPAETRTETQPQPIQLAKEEPSRPVVKPVTIGFTWLVRAEDIAVGAAVDAQGQELDYHWMQYDVARNTWSDIAAWNGSNWAAWVSTPGVYWLHLEVRERQTQQVVGTKTIPFKYSAGTTGISGTYAGKKGRSVLLGVSSNNPNARYTMLIFDVEKKQWIARFDGQWALWDPTPGTYWTHFEVYTSDNRLAESHTYPFGVPFVGYYAPEPYLQVTDNITPLGNATNTLTPGFNGVKVKIAQHRLGVWYQSKLATMDEATVSAVRSFQRRAGLPITGIIDETTWRYLNTGWQWNIDTYQATPVALSANREQRIEAMIHYAWSQSGSGYTWGGAGFYGLGFDCSGLVLQSLYAAGLDPQPINVLLHAYPQYRTSQELYRYPLFKHVPVGERKRGDIVFYTDANGTIIHTGVYVGNNQIIHTDWMGRPARVDSVFYSRLAPTVVRPFP